MSTTTAPPIARELRPLLSLLCLLSPATVFREKLSLSGKEGRIVSQKRMLVLASITKADVSIGEILTMDSRVCPISVTVYSY